MLIVSDVHDAFDALERVASTGETLLILGDLVNLIDYRTLEGILPDIVGREAVAELTSLRQSNRSDAARDMWIARVAELGIDVRSAVAERMQRQYDRMHDVLDGVPAYVTFGNADDPNMLRSNLPASATFVDGDVVTIDGWTIGFVGGGIPRVGSSGEVSHEDMRRKLGTIGPVDVLCTHVPPDLRMLAEDVVAGSVKASVPVLEYIDEQQPRFHFFGDVHQPRAVSMSRGRTLCRNVGYFRATGRAVEFTR
ncbi:MAG: metallophosphoesterase family protein [Acidimicrobiia bacterium]